MADISAFYAAFSARANSTLFGRFHNGNFIHSAARQIQAAIGSCCYIADYPTA
jgi:hypothetical protein